jgi:hypothetical protein
MMQATLANSMSLIAKYSGIPAGYGRICVIEGFGYRRPECRRNDSNYTRRNM